MRRAEPDVVGLQAAPNREILPQSTERSAAPRRHTNRDQRSALIVRRQQRAERIVMTTIVCAVTAAAVLVASTPAGQWSANIPDLDGTKKEFLFVFDVMGDSVSGRVTANG